VTRVLIDTSVYVDWFRAGRHEEIITGRRGPPALSAVVAMELLAGERDHERLLTWTARFERARRLIVPGWPVWALAARVLQRLRRRGGAEQALTNDVLIAMTARVGGYQLFTTNREHFERIAAIEPFHLVVVA
jgi:predicted nucleic acid-binding protein